MQDLLCLGLALVFFAGSWLIWKHPLERAR